MYRHLSTGSATLSALMQSERAGSPQPLAEIVRLLGCERDPAEAYSASAASLSSGATSIESATTPA